VDYEMTAMGNCSKELIIGRVVLVPSCQMSFHWANSKCCADYATSFTVMGRSIVAYISSLH